MPFASLRALRFSAIVPLSLAPPPGGHATGQHPASESDAELDLPTLAAHARRLEAAGFSALFVGDAAAGPGEPREWLDRTAQASPFEPLTLLSALATLTHRIGLVATTTTSFNEPFHVARRLASLDHISAGRAGWNVDTSVVPRQPGGFTRGEQKAYEERYERAEEFVHIVRGLWDSYADDAIVADKRSGLYFRPGGRRALDHAGKHFRVAGPLNVSRPPQGHPVVFQAAADSTEIALASRHADVVLSAARSMDEARAYRAQLDDALVAAGRAPRSVPMWVGLACVLGDSETLFVDGASEQVADGIAEWHEAGVVDGFTVRSSTIPAGPDPFLDEVLPSLARRGVFAPPNGATLRDSLGLSRPERSVA